MSRSLASFTGTICRPRARAALDRLDLECGVRVEQDSDHAYFGNQLLQQREPLAPSRLPPKNDEFPGASRDCRRASRRAVKSVSSSSPQRAYAQDKISGFSAIAITVALSSLPKSSIYSRSICPHSSKKNQAGPQRCLHMG